MKQQWSAIMIGIVLTVGVAGLLGSRMAYSEEVDTKQLKKDIAAILENQKSMQAQLQSIQEELNVVKIRCSG